METTVDLFYDVQNIAFRDAMLLLTVDNWTYSINLQKVIPKLYKAEDSVKKSYDIAPNGYGIHWTVLDEDYSVRWLIRNADKVEKVQDAKVA